MEKLEHKSKKYFPYSHDCVKSYIDAIDSRAVGTLEHCPSIGHPDRYRCTKCGNILEFKFESGESILLFESGVETNYYLMVENIRRERMNG